MMDNVVTLHDLNRSCGHYLRLGHTNHRLVEQLCSASSFPIKRAVIDAPHMEKQSELIATLRSSGVELVLDTKAAELATPGGYTTKARELPWAHSDRHHITDDFSYGELRTFADEITEFVGKSNVSAVLAPTRILNGPQDTWLTIDIKTCEALRYSLDRAGCNNVSIDYPLIIPYQNSLADEARRNAYIRALGNLPIENVWLRIAGFHAGQAAAGVRKYINAARDFTRLDKPLIADCIGRYPALALLAFGAVGAICHGISVNESYRPSHLKRANEGPGGPPKRIYLSNLDLSLKIDEARYLLEVKGAKSKLMCNDPLCCPDHTVRAFGSPDRHFIIQRAKQIRELNAVPTLRRPTHFIEQFVRPAGEVARSVHNLGISKKSIREKVEKCYKSHRNLAEVLSDLNQTEENPVRLRIPNYRPVTRATTARIRGNP